MIADGRQSGQTENDTTVSDKFLMKNANNEYLSVGINGNSKVHHRRQ